MTVVWNNSRKLSLLFFANVYKMLQEIVFQKIESMSPLTSMYHAWQTHNYVINYTLEKFHAEYHLNETIISCVLCYFIRSLYFTR